MKQQFYICPSCGKLQLRQSRRKKISSWCDDTREFVEMKKVESPEDAAEVLRALFLNNLIDIKSFTKKNQLFIEMAFSQGAVVMYHSLKNLNILKKEI